MTHLREAITDAHAVGDLASLLGRLDAITAQLEERRKRSEAARAKARQQAAVAKEQIVTEAEGLADVDRVEAHRRPAARAARRSGRRLRGWSARSTTRCGSGSATPGPAFDKRRRAHFAELDEHRGEAAARKEKLIKKAEELSSSKEWGDTAKAYRDLMTEWKAAGRARRDVEDALWARFRAAQDVFFAARSEVFAARDAELSENLEKKRALVVEAEALLPVTDHKAARAALRSDPRALGGRRARAAGRPRRRRGPAEEGRRRGPRRPRRPSGPGPTRRPGRAPRRPSTSCAPASRTSRPRPRRPAPPVRRRRRPTPRARSRPAAAGWSRPRRRSPSSPDRTRPALLRGREAQGRPGRRRSRAATGW